MRIALFGGVLGSGTVLVRESVVYGRALGRPACAAPHDCAPLQDALRSALGETAAALISPESTRRFHTGSQPCYTGRNGAYFAPGRERSSYACDKSKFLEAERRDPFALAMWSCHGDTIEAREGVL